MTTKDELLKTRFLLNMGRINGLVRLLFSHDALKPTGLFCCSEGARADILRSIVVFLHATFEDVLRSHIPKPNKSLSFYSRTDFERVLKLSGIDAKPFRHLYPPLTQMAKRRKRIVHEADLPDHTAVASKVWNIADEWQLIMWLMAVSAFYSQLRMSTGVANVVDHAWYERLRKAMTSHVSFGKQLIAFTKVPQELRIQALRETVVTLESIISMLHLDPRDFIPDSG